MRADRSFLLDMLVAARKAAEFAQSLTYSEFERSDLHQYAVFKALEIVGEAAARVSEDIRKAQPEIPWHDIVGVRNRIVHVYFEIDLGIVWTIVNEDLPALIERLERIVPPEAG